MEIKFSSIHSIDLDQGSVNYRDHKNDFEEALSRMLQQINMQENLKKYIEKSQDTLVLKTVKEVCKKIYKNELDINSFNKYAYKIAYHLLEIELFLDDRQQKTIGNRIQRGSLLQAIVYNEEKERYEYYLSKFEHAEFYSELDFIKTIGIQIKNTKVYKSCRLIFSVNDEDCIEFEDAEVYVNNNAKYWSGEFLELSEASTDEYNTKTSFNEIRKCLNINVKKQYPADHPILFNAFYGYFKKEKRTINYYDMLDEIMDGYVGTDMSKDDVERLKAKLESLPKTKKFDTQFTTNPDVISAKIKQTYDVISGVELVLNRKNQIENIKETISSVIENDEMYIKIKVTEPDTFNAFKRKEE